MEHERTALQQGLDDKLRYVEDAKAFTRERAEPVPDLSRLSGPSGEFLGLSETRDPRGGLLGAYRLPRGYREDSPPVVDERETSAGVPLDVALAFPCRAILVDNYTSQWAFVGRRYIAPYQMGTSIWMPIATQRGQIKWLAPPGYTQPAIALTDAIIMVTFCECEIQDYGGFSGFEFLQGAQPLHTVTHNVSVLTTTTAVLSANPNRASAVLTNDDATHGMWIREDSAGAPSIDHGKFLPAGASLRIDGTDGFHAIAITATSKMSIAEDVR